MTLSSFPASTRRRIALRALHRLPTEELPGIALDLLSDSASDSPALGALAGALARVDPRELADLFERSLADLHLTLPCEADAAQFLIHDAACEAVRGALSVRAAAAAIVELCFLTGRDDRSSLEHAASFGVRTVVSLSYAYDDVSDDADVSVIDGELGNALAEVAASLESH